MRRARASLGSPRSPMSTTLRGSHTPRSRASSQRLGRACRPPQIEVEARREGDHAQPTLQLAGQDLEHGQRGQRIAAEDHGRRRRRRARPRGARARAGTTPPGRGSRRRRHRSRPRARRSRPGRRQPARETARRSAHGRRRVRAVSERQADDREVGSQKVVLGGRRAPMNVAGEPESAGPADAPAGELRALAACRHSRSRWSRSMPPLTTPRAALGGDGVLVDRHPEPWGVGHHHRGHVVAHLALESPRPMSRLSPRAATAGRRRRASRWRAPR